MQRYAARYREQQQRDEVDRERVWWVRFVALTAAFTPMVAVGALPVTALLGFGTSVLANATSAWVGLVVMITVVVVMGAWTARFALANQGAPRDRGWRRLVPFAITAGVVAAGLTEIVSGSKAADPVLALWFLAFAWMIVFVPRGRRRWSGAERILWAAAPTVTAVTIVVVWTAGLFAYRFDRSIDELDAYVKALEAGEQYQAGVEVGDFTIKNRGILRGCDRAFRIEGWHELDDRWIAYCPSGEPTGDGIDHLAGHWYEFPGR